MAANWEFDTADTTSTNHSVTWGTVTISQYSSTEMHIAKGDTALLDRETMASATTTYTIYKATNAMLVCLHYNGYDNNSGCFGILITRNTSLVNSANTEKIVFVETYASSGVNVPKYGSDLKAYGSNSSNNLFVLCTEGMQVFPFVQPNGAYMSDNAYIVTRANSNTLMTTVTFGGETYAVCYGVAIKEE
jgi:hypothetical protein